jgi:predicted component of type VI protein secretion system
MNFNKFLSLLSILLTGFAVGCMSSADKQEMEELREALHSRPSLIPGGKYRPCCMVVSIIDKQAKDIFDKMPDNTLLTTSTQEICLDKKVVKVSEGTMCTVAESHLNNPALYSCSIIINYSTGATQKIDIKEYFNCDAEY